VLAGTYRHPGSRSAMLRHTQVGDLVGDRKAKGRHEIELPSAQRAGVVDPQSSPTSSPTLSMGCWVLTATGLRAYSATAVDPCGGSQVNRLTRKAVLELTNTSSTDEEV